MKPPGRLLRIAFLRLSGVRVYALVGPSGTGKSFRARLIAEKHAIDVIVDDGILISGDAILTGHWAKKEQTLLAATRRALFDSPEHAREAREALRSLPLRAVLIVGTSRRMADRIASALDLPRPSTVITIDEVAPSDRIETAGRMRRRTGSHAIPAPVASIERGFFASLADRAGDLAAAVRRRTARDHRLRASVSWEKPHRGGGEPLGAAASRDAGRRSARPRGDVEPRPRGDVEPRPRGGVAISEAAVREMVAHCVAEHDPRIAVGSVRIRKREGMHVLEVGIRIPFAQETSGDLHRLREYVLHSMERYAGIVVREVRLVVESVEA
jgi:hypothetical protein